MKRFFDDFFDRFLNGPKHATGRDSAKLCSTRGGCPRAASEAVKSGLVDRVACDDRARARRTGQKGADFGEHGGGVVVDFCGRGAVRDEGIGRRGSGQGGKGRGREREGFWGRGVGF